MNLFANLLDINALLFLAGSIACVFIAGETKRTSLKLLHQSLLPIGIIITFFTDKSLVESIYDRIFYIGLLGFFLAF